MPASSPDFPPPYGDCPYSAKIYSVEGPAWIVPAFENKWNDPEAKARLLEIVRKVEQQESMHGMSPHLLGVAFC
ncbi:hypothetical protein [Paenibacillus macerans]|uniref:hypothetical protein n=1 Tax=Paenibacillus macerans TaxID=44252 RepID=UPI00203BC51B|nr:hypothetical protein [Paenibacillus macerans]MCM3699391.1 hypothetical protein [Paenibacillus macerans]